VTFRRVGVTLVPPYPDGSRGLLQELKRLETFQPDFVEVWPENLGVVLGGRLEEARTRAVTETLLRAGHSYTVHAPLEADLMDPTAPALQRGLLESAVRFASGIGASTVVCHAGQRVAGRDALHSLKRQMSLERDALRALGDLAGEAGITLTVENYYPDLPVVRGEVYDYSLRPSELAERVAAVDHPAVGVCLDTGHAALAANACGLDLFEECAAAAPLVRHIHLQDNFGRPNLSGRPSTSEHRLYGLGDLHLPPGRGSIPLADLFRVVRFPSGPACCVELVPETYHAAAEAVAAARRIGHAAEAA
jgi:sugar phosphate isomerase/epimerase